MLMLSVLLLVIATGWALLRTYQDLQSSRHQRDELEAKLALQPAPSSRKLAGNFFSTWPGLSAGALVVNDLGRYAKAHELHLGSLSVHRQPATAREVAHERYTLSLSGAYPAIKLWLHEIQQRHPSLAVENLALRAVPNDAARQEASLSLVLYVQDE
ncbi:MAG: GspMb/PilO family protein [Comamonas sp.]